QFVDEGKIRVIPYGVDLERFKYSSLPEGHNILTVGRLIKRRGVDYLIKAMPRILKGFPDTQLNIVGEGPRKKILEKIAERLDIRENVFFYNYVHTEKLIELYRNCTVFCHLLFAGGWNQPALEAMATGRPVICTNAPHNSMVENGETGFLVPFGDVNLLAEKILTLLEDKELAERMGKKGRRKVENEYNWNKIAEEYYKVMKGIV
ncbi:MAG: glycosyltransferase family 4 protein, partial [Candidatus Marinimicrobia bacterium]|nr:glycosyltransferase family 4 protein [Candidatus Neomarinimicrobiota bacterium]